MRVNIHNIPLTGKREEAEPKGLKHLRFVTYVFKMVFKARQLKKGCLMNSFVKEIPKIT